MFLAGVLVVSYFWETAWINQGPEDFENLNKELEEVMANELPETGAQQEVLKAEADRVLEYAKQYVEQADLDSVKGKEIPVFTFFDSGKIC